MQQIGEIETCFYVTGNFCHEGNVVFSRALNLGLYSLCLLKHMSMSVLVFASVDELSELRPQL